MKNGNQVLIRKYHKSGGKTPKVNSQSKCQLLALDDEPLGPATVSSEVCMCVCVCENECVCVNVLDSEIRCSYWTVYRLIWAEIISWKLKLK